MSLTIDRLKQLFNQLTKNATIKFEKMDEIGKIFSTSLQQIEYLEKSKEKWKARALKAEGK